MEEYRQKAVDLLEQLVADYPTVPDYRHLLARCYRETPPWSDRGSDSEPRSLYQAARILEKLVEEYPDVADYRYDLSETYAMLGDRESQISESVAGDASESAPTMLDKALAISEQLVAEHPNIPEYAVSSVNIRLRRDDELRESDPAAAEANLRKALELQSALARRFPENHSYTFWLAVIQESLGGLLKDQGRLSDARSALEDCIASFQDVLQNDVKAGHVRGILAKNYQTLADVLYQLGDAQAAQQALHRALDLRPEQ
jgi:tetratricopeptide (TPR) repeat protein